MFISTVQPSQQKLGTRLTKLTVTKLTTARLSRPGAANERQAETVLIIGTHNLEKSRPTTQNNHGPPLAVLSLTMSKQSKPSSSFDAFATVDQMVAKTVYGSDGAASWQKFRQGTKQLANHQSVAPGLQVKKNDRLGSGLSSLAKEREHEQAVRRQAGHADCELNGIWNWDDP